MFIVVDLPSIFNDHSMGPKGQWWPWWYTMNLCVCYFFSGKLISNPHFSEQDQSTTSVGNIYLFIG